MMNSTSSPAVTSRKSLSGDDARRVSLVLSPMKSLGQKLKALSPSFGKNSSAGKSVVTEDGSSSFTDEESSLDTKEEALCAVKKAVESYEEQLKETTAQLESDQLMAFARYESSHSNTLGPVGNPRGAIMSLKKCKQGQAVCRNLQAIINNLRDLEAVIEKDNISPKGYELLIQAAVEDTQSDEKIDYSDQDLLRELSEHLAQQQE